jgi:transcriptional regulator with XRE-family HTH domain
MKRLDEVVSDLEALKSRLETETDAELARYLGVSRSHIGRVLKGEAKPGAKILDEIGLKPLVVYVDNK